MDRLSNAFGRILDGLMLVACLLLLAMAVMIGADVVTRNVGLGGIAWSGEVSENIIYLLTLLAALQIFGTVQVLTNGGPGYLTEVPTLRIYKEGFQFHRFGVAAAMSGVFGAILVALSLFQIWLGRRSYSEGD